MININIFKSLGSMRLQIDLEIKKGEFLAIAGESGSGKTTLLRVLAGLEKGEGVIKFGDEVWLNEKKSLPPHKRGIGFLFQDYALFPNMTLLQNLLYVNRDRELANYLLEITGLLEMSNRYPNSLSGGQQQRVSLARALMSRPKLLLLDEPLSAIDPDMRERLQSEILTLHKEFKTTTVMVSHNRGEVYRMADRVAILDSGKIVQEGTPQDIFSKKEMGKVVSIEKVGLEYLITILAGDRLIETKIPVGKV